MFDIYDKFPKKIPTFFLEFHKIHPEISLVIPTKSEIPELFQEGFYRNTKGVPKGDFFCKILETQKKIPNENQEKFCNSEKAMNFEGRKYKQGLS